MLKDEVPEVSLGQGNLSTTFINGCCLLVTEACTKVCGSGRCRDAIKKTVPGERAACPGARIGNCVSEFVKSEQDLQEAILWLISGNGNKAWLNNRAGRSVSHLTIVH